MCAWRRPRCGAGRRKSEGRSQPRYADLASSQRLETQQKPERETGEQDAIVVKTYELWAYSRLVRQLPPGARRAHQGMDMIGPMRVTTKLAFALAIPTFVILSGAVTLAYAQASPSPTGSSTASAAAALPGDPT